MTGPSLRTFLQWLPMTLRIKSKILIMPTQPCMTLLLYLLAYGSPLSSDSILSLATTLKLSWPSGCSLYIPTYSHLGAFTLTIVSAWSAPLLHLHMACSFSLFKVFIQMSPHQRGFPWPLSLHPLSISTSPPHLRLSLLFNKTIYLALYLQTSCSMRAEISSILLCVYLCVCLVN